MRLIKPCDPALVRSFSAFWLAVREWHELSGIRLGHHSSRVGASRPSVGPMICKFLSNWLLSVSPQVAERLLSGQTEA